MQRIDTIADLASVLAIDESVTPMGPSLLGYAEACGYADPDFLGMQLMMHPGTVPMLDHKTGNSTWVTFIPSHTEGGYWGPVLEGDVMVIGKMPWDDEVRNNRLFSGPSGNLWKSIIASFGVDYSDWYLTNVVRFRPPGRRRELAKSWKDECRWFLDEEIRLVKPKHILAMGADALRAVYGKSASLKRYRGVDALQYMGAKVHVTTHPASILRDPVQMDAFHDDLERFVAGTGKRSIAPPKATSYYDVTTEEELSALVDLWIAEGCEWFSLDAEWGGVEKSDWLHGELRTVQICVKEREAYCIVLRDEDLQPVMDTDAAMLHLGRLLKRPGVKLVGHNLRSDLKWFYRHGVDLRDQYLAGVDTATMFHLLYPSQGKDMALENLAIKYTDKGRYDWPLESWLTRNQGARARVKKQGYAHIPQDILHPYACGDVDVVMRVMPILIGKLKETTLDNPYVHNGRSVSTLWDFYRAIVHPTSLPLMEIEINGLAVDEARLRSLVEMFRVRRDDMVDAFREQIKWPDFNYRSVFNVRELLYGFRSTTELLKMASDPPKEHRKDAPEGSTCLRLKPIKTTDNPRSKEWKKVSAEEMEYVEPSTDAESLQILAVEAVEAKALVEIRFVDQVIKNFLRLPDEDGDGEVVIDEETGEEVFSTGLIGHIDPDGRIRTDISQFTDTGRYRSSSPNLQNIQKRQEARLREIFCPDIERLKATPRYDGLSIEKLKEMGLIDPRYHALRSCFTSLPGWVLLETDYSQAELNVLARLSGDTNLTTVMDDTSRDLHSEIACAGLSLDCEPGQVKKFYPNKRDGAKTVVYGTLYGRGPGAVVRELQKMGIHDVEFDDAVRLQDTLFGQCPRVAEYIDQMHARVYDPGYVENPYGRRRYFPWTDDEAVRGEQERQAVNMPIQGTVADVLSIALSNLHWYRGVDPDVRYLISVPVHDSILTYVWWEDVDKMINEVLPLCMREMAEVPHIGLKLQIDIDPVLRWGVKASKEQVIEQAVEQLAV